MLHLKLWKEIGNTVWLAGVETVNSSIPPGRERKLPCPHLLSKWDSVGIFMAKDGKKRLSRFKMFIKGKHREAGRQGSYVQQVLFKGQKGEKQNAAGMHAQALHTGTVPHIHQQKEKSCWQERRERTQELRAHRSSYNKHIFTLITAPLLYLNYYLYTHIYIL